LLHYLRSDILIESPLLVAPVRSVPRIVTAGTGKNGASAGQRFG